jgi:hypothetical protein
LFLTAELYSVLKFLKLSLLNDIVFDIIGLFNYGTKIQLFFKLPNKSYFIS